MPRDGTYNYSFDLDFTVDEVMPVEVQACKRLFAAKLLTHAKDYVVGLRVERAVRNTTREKVSPADFSAAERWLFSNNDEPSSFVWTCGLLNLDPERVRNTIVRNWRTI